ncbi:aldehyde ferredoxin oxidoreductase family protein [Desulfosediminicola ganghwensis]|uniref:aldehyde ferredoxin oxidoreductase family protein n=1 Tax=Desulfosediminicola ganghwensis TaxID=2569540 RepID=UPI0010ABA55A|nr:aldehyde ferredoxin oxidoreductase family protein [Desulfosediminicola ganghwensis]
MYGFYNKLLKIDVTDNSFESIEITDELLREQMGGKGLASHLLMQLNPPGVDPLGPDNHLIFSVGPVAATRVWGSCRYGVFTKSPQTGFYAESYSGGTVAEYIAATGYDAIVFHGRSEELVWVEVSDDTVRFHSAEQLRGLDTYATEDRIKQWISANRPETPKCGVSVVGPAAENGVTFALIENDYWRSAGRTGAGAVLGAKNIKAIAFHGRQKAEVADPKLVAAFARELSERSKTDNGVKAYKKLGTPMMVDVLNEARAFPTRYWSKGQSEHRENINATALHERCEVRPNACRKCFMACGRLSTVKSGKHQGLTVEGPEYETIYAFGGLCEVDNIEDILYLNDLCDRLGMDTITAGNLVGLAIEAVLQGRIELDLSYGDTEAIARLLRDIAYRQGYGDVLADGIKVAAEQWDMVDQAIHVKGLEPAGYDPRVLKGMGLAYGTSARGACHLRATFYKPEITGMSDPEKIQGKSEMFVEWEDRLTFFDTLILCRFYRDMYQWQELATMVKGVTGLDLSEQAMVAISRRITDNTRLFNIREGLTVEDDRLPKRFAREVLPESGRVISEENMTILLGNYYKTRGWDEEGIPVPKG